MAFACKPQRRPPSRCTATAAPPTLPGERLSSAERSVDVAAAAAASGLGHANTMPVGVAVDRLFAEGVCAFARGQMVEAEAAFERAAQIAAMSDEQTPEMRAVEDAATERIRLCRTDTSAVAVEIAAVAAASSRGSKAHRRGNHCEALRQYDKALAQAANLMWTCRKAGDSPKEEFMQRRMVSLLSNRAAVHLSLQNYCAAEADSRAVLAAAPDHRVARDCLSSVRRRQTRADAAAGVKASSRDTHTPGSSRGGGAFPRPEPPKVTRPPQRCDPAALAILAEEHVRAKKAGFRPDVIQTVHTDNSERWLSNRTSDTGTRKQPAAPPVPVRVRAVTRPLSAPTSTCRVPRRQPCTATSRSGRVVDLEGEFDV